MPLMALTLYEFNFLPLRSKKSMNSYFGYILVLHNDFIILDVSNPSTSFSLLFLDDDDDETN